MIKALQLLFLGHVHTWELEEQSDTDIYWDDSKDKTPLKTVRTFQYRCVSCGIRKIKRHRV
jgi:hypothetical protein